jgi:hypothetical protein
MLKTNYKDDIPAAGVSAPRKYQMIDNGDGTVSFVDATEYQQTGDPFGGSDINATNIAVNKCTEYIEGTLAANTTTLTLTDSRFFADGHIDVYVPENLAKKMIPTVALTDGQCVLTFDSTESSAMTVHVYCK